MAQGFEASKGLIAAVLQNVTIILAVLGALAATYRWSKEQDWKRTDAALQTIKSLDETPGTRNAMMILKSPLRPIPLYDRTSPPSTGYYAEVSWEEAKWSLIPTIDQPSSSPKLNAIRDSFEDFMNRLTQIELYVESGLLSKENVALLVEPWVRRLDGTTDDGGLTRNFRVYTVKEHKIGVIRLFKRFGVDVTTSFDGDYKRFRAELAAFRTSASPGHSGCATKS